MRIKIPLRLTTIALLALCPFYIKGQNIKDRILTCDSVIIMSHEELLTDAGPGKLDFYRELVIKSLPNKEILKQQMKLSIDSRNALSKIFAKMEFDSLFSPNSCFIPHHSVLFYKNGLCSYLDICFGCKVFTATKDIKYEKNILRSDAAFEELKLFFKDKGINYKIDD